MPISGRLSDVFGRRPILQAASSLGTLIRASVVIHPSWFTLTLVRVLGAFTSNVFRTTVDAALSDIYSGTELAVRTAQVKTWIAVALAVSPAIGGRLAQRSPILPFVVCAILSGLNSVQLWATFQE